MAWSSDVNKPQPQSWARPDFVPEGVALPPPDRKSSRDEDSPVIKELRRAKEFEEAKAAAKERLYKSRKARAKLRDFYDAADDDEDVENKIDSPANRLIRREIMRIAKLEPHRLDAIIDMLYTMAEAGDQKAMRMIFERIDGAVTQQLELRNPQSDKPGESQPFEIRIVGADADYSKWESQ